MKPIDEVRTLNQSDDLHHDDHAPVTTTILPLQPSQARCTRSVDALVVGFPPGLYEELVIKDTGVLLEVEGQGEP